MFNKIGRYAIQLSVDNNPWTNVYGLARTILAIAMMMTLAFNDVSIFFRPISGRETFPLCEGAVSLFCTVPSDLTYLNVLRWVCVLVLLIVASGWRPRITAIFHLWIAYSMQVSAVTLDGGEQVNLVMTLLLLPIALTDSRKWHWTKVENNSDALPNNTINQRIIAIVSFHAIRFQIAILYLHSFIAKLFEETWIDGTAVYYFLQDPMVGLPPFLWNIVEPILTSSAVVIPTWGTLILQMFLFGAFFAPKRHWKYYLMAAMFLHELIAVMLGLISFSMSMSAALILYLIPFESNLDLLKKLKFAFIKKRDASLTELKQVSN